jgi:tetratricopeptide (TPR) repeat protein
MMFKRILFLPLLITIGLSLKAQQFSYFTDLDSANAAYKKKDFQRAGTYYEKAFKSNGNKSVQGEFYNAACTWSLAGKPDKAFKYLEDIIQDHKNIIRSWNDPGEFYNMLVKDADFENLRKLPKWEKLLARAKTKKEKFEANLDQGLTEQLKTMREEDQKGRLELNKIQKEKGFNSAEEKALWKVIDAQDSINLIKAKALIQSHGWLSPQQVGYKGNQALFLIIQHADLATQKQYLPLMRKSMAEGKISASSLALLEDRILMRENRKQIYGSQLRGTNGKYYLFPVQDVTNLDKKRASVGLGSISAYLKGFNLEWDTEAYKKQLQELVKEFAVKD